MKFQGTCVSPCYVMTFTVDWVYMKWQGTNWTDWFLWTANRSAGASTNTGAAAANSDLRFIVIDGQNVAMA